MICVTVKILTASYGLKTRLKEILTSILLPEPQQHRLTPPFL